MSVGQWLWLVAVLAFYAAIFYGIARSQRKRRENIDAIFDRIKRDGSFTIESDDGVTFTGRWVNPR